MGAAGVRDQRQAPRVAARRQDRDLQHRRGESPEGIQGRADGGAGTGRAAAGAPDRRVLEHGSHPAVGGDLRRADSRLVWNLVIRSLIPFVLALAATAAAAQSTVTRIVVPFGAGGVQDILARAISAELGAALGQKLIVENRTGAGGTIGTASVAKAAPDGHTLILAAASHTINGSLYAKLPYDPIGDFTGVAHIGTVGYVLMVSAALSVRTVGEFVDYARANPGKLNYSTAGSGRRARLSTACTTGLGVSDRGAVRDKAT